MKKYIIVILLISTIMASFFLGVKLSKSGIERLVNGIKAELRFANLQVYRDLQSDFLSNCGSRVESRLEHIIDEQKMLMAEYVQNVSDENFEEYINKRDSNLMNELRSYEINWNKTWTLPDCQEHRNKNGSVINDNHPQ